jgi:hypothetical protein
MRFESLPKSLLRDNSKAASYLRYIRARYSRGGFRPIVQDSAGLYRSRLIRLNRAELLGQRGCETTQIKLATNLERAPIDTRPPDLRRSAVQELSVGGQKSRSTVAKHFTDRPRALPLSLRQVACGVQARQEWRSGPDRALARRDGHVPGLKIVARRHYGPAATRLRP